jgi:uncharacterized protein (DUF2062 family)
MSPPRREATAVAEEDVARAQAATTEGRPASPSARRRRRLRRALADLHVRLRTEGDTPRRRALAVALGVLIGCTPLWGLHLALCTVLARLLKVSRVLTYLAAHVNNPLTAPFLLWLQWGVGHLLLEGSWPALSWQTVRQHGALRLTRDVVVGSLVVGAALGIVLGLAAWAWSALRHRPSPLAHLREAAAEPYLRSGVAHWEFVRGKLRYDPLYRGLLDAGLLPRRGRLVDLGCGRGILLALLAVVADADPEAPPMELLGFELRPAHADAARSALAALVPEHAAGEDRRVRAEVRRADLTDPAFTVPPCDTAVLLDVLHYLPAAAQERLLRRTAGALPPGGLLLLRDADADGGWRFRATAAAERLCALARGRLRPGFHYRGRRAWQGLLQAHGLAVESRPLSQGTPYANVLLVARKGAAERLAGPAGGT